jgi:hypothetical protein
MDFKDWFCLKQRDSFTIDPKIHPSDARFYFGRQKLEERMKKQITRSFIDPGVPKMMVFGPYGSGKTQTLYYLAHWLQTDPPPTCKRKPFVAHLDIEVQSKSTALKWHLQNMEAIGMETVQGWLNKLFDSTPHDKYIQAIENIAGDPNLAKAFGHLRGGGDLGFLAWRWLSGLTLSPKDLQEIKVTRNLGDVGVGDLVLGIQACGNLAASVGSCLILFIDEMEELRNIREGDAFESWHQYVRKLSDNANASVGFVSGFFAATFDDAPEMLIRGDVRGRISQNNYIELDTLSAPNNVKEFVGELLAHFIDRSEAEKRIQADHLPSTIATYPLTASAFELLSDYACQDPTKATPRNIIRTINECAIAAWDLKKKVIEDDIVNEIAPIVFA